jgi:crotonobetainyl-CoA:carnitine CoA-transferase CaiB-like acyl-CoA transferase
VYNDPQIREGGYLTRVQMGDGKSMDLPVLPWRFEGAPEPYVMAAPTLGQHNDYVFKDLLGLSEPDIASLVEERIIY